MRRTLSLTAVLALTLAMVTPFGVAQGGPGPTGATGAPFWSLEGNAGTDPATQFVGTIDNQPLNLRVNNQRALRLEPGDAPNLIGGWSGNSVDGGVIGASIGGGGCPGSRCGADQPNRVTRNFGTVGGGLGNTASGDLATVGGGRGNTGSRFATTVGGGLNNTASGIEATVGGGLGNTASGTNAIVGGGGINTASGIEATVGGGLGNTASGTNAIVGGGRGNTASGNNAIVPGGWFNTAAGEGSFAAGHFAKANHHGAFVWGDFSSLSQVASPGHNTFSVRAAGGIWLGTTSSPSIGAGRFIDTSTGAHLTTGGAWTNASSSSFKGGFRPVDPEGVLDAVASLPITTWHYTAQPGVSHIGPVSEDFHAAFGVGGDDESITTVDADGVALAAIQGLHERNERLQAEVADLREEISSGVRVPEGAGGFPSAMWGLAGALGLLGLGLGRRWERRMVGAT